MVELIEASREYDFEQGRVLFRHYAEWLQTDLSFQNFAAELLHMDDMYADYFKVPWWPTRPLL